MGPEFTLQRVLAADGGLAEDPDRNPDADCESRSPKDPQFEQREAKIIPLMSDDLFIFTCAGKY